MAEDSFFRRRGDESRAAWDQGSRLFKLGPPLEAEPAGGWSSTAVELDRNESEMVRAVKWVRDDETIITLQWFLNGTDGTQFPINVPPTPDMFS